MQVINSGVSAAQDPTSNEGSVSGNSTEQIKAFAPSCIIKIGNTSYIFERHFSGERDLREAIFEAVKNEAFRAS